MKPESDSEKQARCAKESIKLWREEQTVSDEQWARRKLFRKASKYKQARKKAGLD